MTRPRPTLVMLAGGGEAPSPPRMPPRGSDLETWRAYFDALAIAHGRAPLAVVKGGAK